MATGSKAVKELLYKKLIEDNFSLSEKIILRYRSKEFSYRNLYEQSISLGCSWIEKGAKTGDRVAVSCSDSSETIIALLACLAFGLIFVPIEQGNLEEEKHIIYDSGAKIQFSGGIPKVDVNLTRIVLPPETIGYIIYTSGSTSVSKGVVAPLKAIDFCIESINKRLCNNNQDHILCKLPLSFDYGLYQVFIALRFGAELTIMDKESNIFSIPKQLAERKITAFPVVPTMLAALLHAGLLKENYYPCLRYISSTGEVLDTKLIAEVKNVLPSVSIIPMYGLTECKRVSIMPPDRKDKILAGSCGLPLDGVEVRLFNEDMDEGELLVYGPNIMNGYWGDEETTAKVFCIDKDGKRFLRTGDSFSIDKEGFLYFRQRLKNMIKVAGHAVSVTNLENILNSIDGVLDIRIVGVPDSVYGELICACIYTNSNEVKKKILELSNTLPFHKQIRRVILFDKPFPTNKNGKVDITALRRLADKVNEL
jgi:acyl-CoA synthetase (AMP-forming)/AMP-acid ligase II